MDLPVFEIFVAFLFLAEILFSSVPYISDCVMKGVIEWDGSFGDFNQNVVHMNTHNNIDVSLFSRDKLVEQPLKLLVLVFSVLDVF